MSVEDVSVVFKVKYKKFENRKQLELQKNEFAHLKVQYFGFMGNSFK